MVIAIGCRQLSLGDSEAQVRVTEGPWFASLQAFTALSALYEVLLNVTARPSIGGAQRVVRKQPGSL